MSNNNRSLGLVVEDVQAMRAYLRALLEDDSIEIAEASTLEGARAFLRATPTPQPEFILLDLELPDGNGLDLMPDIDSETRVIALTADIRHETELQCYNAGCELVIEKDGKLASLRDVVRSSVKDDAVMDIDNLAGCFSYVTYLAKVRAELEAARCTSDYLTMRQIAHRLRGTAVHFGYPGIGSAAKTIGISLGAGRLDQFDTAVSALSARIGDALEAHHRKSYPSANAEAI